MANGSAARQRPRTVRVPERAEQLAESFLSTVSRKVTREELLQIFLLRGAQEIDRYPDRVLGLLHEVRQGGKARRSAP